MSSLYILDINPLWDIWCENVFSQSVDCLFILLMVSFAVQKLFSSMSSHLSILAFVAFAFGVKSKKSLLNPVSRSLLPMSYSKSFRSYIYVFNPFWVNFCVWCKTVVQFYSFACGCPVFPTPFTKETVLSPCIFSAPLS